MRIDASDPITTPIPDQPVVPDAPSPGTPEPEPDRQPGRTGD